MSRGHTVCRSVVVDDVIASTADVIAISGGAALPNALALRYARATQPGAELPLSLLVTQETIP